MLAQHIGQEGIVADMTEELTKLSQLLFFDDLALHYLLRTTPEDLLVTSFSRIDDRLFGAFLRNMEKKQRSDVLQNISKLQKEQLPAYLDVKHLLADGNLSRKGEKRGWKG